MSQHVPLVITVLVGLFLLAWLGNPDHAPQKTVQEKPVEEGLGIGERAPEIYLATLQGGSFSVQERRGKPLVLNFFATWSPPSRKEMELLQEAAEMGEVEVVGVNLGENPSLVRGFAQEIGVKYTLALDPDGKAKASYNVFTQPLTLFIDREGIIRGKKFGALTEEELKESLERIT